MVKLRGAREQAEVSSRLWRIQPGVPRNQRTRTFDPAFELITLPPPTRAQHVHQHEAISWKQLQKKPLLPRPHTSHRFLGQQINSKRGVNTQKGRKPSRIYGTSCSSCRDGLSSPEGSLQLWDPSRAHNTLGVMGAIPPKLLIPPGAAGPGRTGLGAACSSGGCPCPSQGALVLPIQTILCYSFFFFYIVVTQNF